VQKGELKHREVIWLCAWFNSRNNWVSLIWSLSFMLLWIVYIRHQTLLLAGTGSLNEVKSLHFCGNRIMYR